MAAHALLDDAAELHPAASSFFERRQRLRWHAAVCMVLALAAYVRAAQPVPRPARIPAATRPATAPATRPTAYATGKAAKLQLRVPAGWQDLSVPPPNPAMPAAVHFAAREAGGSFDVRLIYVASPRPLTDEQVHDIAQQTASKYESRSVEQQTDLQPLQGEQADGYSATFTDAHPDPGAFPCVTSVTARLGQGLLAATILHHKDSPNLAKALEMLKTATLAGPATQPGTQAAAATNFVRFVAPGGKWALVFDLPDVEPFDPETRADGRGARMMTRTAAGTVVTAFIEPAENKGDARAARKFYWDKEKLAPLDYTDVKMTGDAKLALLSFTTDGVSRNVHAYLVRGDKWVDIHLSQPDGTDADTDRMLAAVKTARIEAIDGGS